MPLSERTSGATMVCARGAAVKPMRQAEASNQNIRRIVTSRSRHYSPRRPADTREDLCRTASRR